MQTISRSPGPFAVASTIGDPEQGQVLLDQLNRSASLQCGRKLKEFARIHRNSVLSLEIQMNILQNTQKDWMSFFKKHERMEDLEEWLPNIPLKDIQHIYTTHLELEYTPVQSRDRVNSSWNVGTVDDLGYFQPDSAFVESHGKVIDDQEMMQAKGMFIDIYS